MNPALQAYFRATSVPGFLRPPHHFVEREIVGRATQVLMRLALGEGTEPATEIADVGVVDIAVDHVSDNIAADRLAQRISRGDHMLIVGVAGGEQSNDLL